ncbi:alkaline phosphatase [Fonsecaea monophora]|uniref:Alkaline phosphatase n=1 Tax=Fonsecaea monophora TaxID=254056 RepID=A0A177F1W0_9EURO|nr:alkaline phosphatase [Fonsecaea monophora]OAG38275.1 alkaline phosphatase [Fonsecaea monophora]
MFPSSSAVLRFANIKLRLSSYVDVSLVLMVELAQVMSRFVPSRSPPSFPDASYVGHVAQGMGRSQHTDIPATIAAQTCGAACHDRRDRVSETSGFAQHGVPSVYGPGLALPAATEDFLPNHLWRRQWHERDREYQ